MTISSTKPFAVVTGASSGIGYELAKQFVGNGYDLLIVSETPKIEGAASDLKSFGTAVESVQLDLAKYEDVEKLYEKIKATGRPVDAAALNAGVGVGGDFARQTELKDELNLINLNVVSTVHLTKRLVKDMLVQGHGRILFTSSIAATMPGPTETNFFHRAGMDDTKIGASEKDDAA